MFKKWAQAATARNAGRAPNRSDTGAYKFCYTATNSSDGEARLLDGNADFAVMTRPLTAASMMRMPNAWMLPSLAGAVAIVFNVPGIDSGKLRITREQLADVFLGKITRWSSLANATMNPSLLNVTESITLIVRRDSSGATEVLTSALSSFSDEWRTSVGTSSLPKWPGAPMRPESDGGDGVAVLIRSIKYSLSYTSLQDVKTFHLALATISNKAGNFVLPSADSVIAAASNTAAVFVKQSLAGSSIFFASLADQDGPKAYPIATFSYVVFDALDCDIAFDLLFFMYWSWHSPTAETTATDQDLVPLPDAIRQACPVRSCPFPLRPVGSWYIDFTDDIAQACQSSLMRLECNGESVFRKIRTAFRDDCPKGTARPALSRPDVADAMYLPAVLFVQAYNNGSVLPHVPGFFCCYKTAQVKAAAAVPHVFCARFAIAHRQSALRPISRGFDFRRLLPLGAGEVYQRESANSVDWKCTPCPEGTFSDNAMDTACQKCPAGAQLQPGAACCMIEGSNKRNLQSHPLVADLS